MESFQELELPTFLRESLHRMNFKKPTPVQAQAIPPGLQGRDVIASAQTGTGKTAGFGIPLLAFLAVHPDKTALILTPTRELAQQVWEVLQKLSGTQTGFGATLLIGGAGMGGQISALHKKPRLIIGTPGRIIDHLERHTLNLSHTGFFVLDEADRMLDMGFAPQLERIRAKLPNERQTLLFSATMPPNIRAMGSLYLRDPIRIAVGGDSKPVETVRQVLLHTSEPRKFDELLAELKERQGSVLLFARTQHRVDRVLKKLKEQGYKATRIHGGRSQAQRRNAIEQFKDGSYDILVATDIAARGLDILNIGHVINYDLPRNAEDYIHRIGRTARAGAQGDSLSFVTPEDRDLWTKILRLMGNAKTDIQTKPSHFKDHAPRPSSQPSSNHGPQGHHPSGHRPPGHHPKGQGAPGHGTGHPQQTRYKDRHQKPHHDPKVNIPSSTHGSTPVPGHVPLAHPSNPHHRGGPDHRDRRGPGAGHGGDNRHPRGPHPGSGSGHPAPQHPHPPAPPHSQGPVPSDPEDDNRGNRVPPPGQGPAHHAGSGPAKGPGHPFRRDQAPFNKSGRSFGRDSRPSSGYRGDRNANPGSSYSGGRDSRGFSSGRPFENRGDRRPSSGGGSPYRGDHGPSTGGGQPYRGDRGPFSGGGSPYRSDRGPSTGGGQSYRGDRSPSSGSSGPYRGDRGPSSGGGHPFRGGPRTSSGPGGPHHGPGGNRGGRHGGKRPFGKKF